MTCWPGVSDLDSDSALTRRRMPSQKRRATLSSTSASSRAVRISLSASSRSASLIRPLPRSRVEIRSRRSERASNMGSQVSGGTRTLFGHGLLCAALRPLRVARGRGAERGRGRVAGRGDGALPVPLARDRVPARVLGRPLGRDGLPLRRRRRGPARAGLGGVEQPLRPGRAGRGVRAAAPPRRPRPAGRCWSRWPGPGTSPAPIPERPPGSPW